MLDYILVIDPSDKIKNLVKLSASEHWPKANIIVYPPEDGMPDETFAWSNYDLVLINHDLGLPDETGLDWLKKIKSMDAAPPVIITSDEPDIDLAVRAVKKGADAYLDKKNMTKKFSQEINELFAAESGDDSIDHEKTIKLEAKDRIRILMSAKKPNENIEEEVVLEGGLGDDTADEADQTLMFKKEDAPTGANEEVVITDPSITAPKTKTGSEEIEVPGYKILRKIGQGGMASIYLAEMEGEGIQVTLKVLHMGSEEDREMLRRFIREYRLVAKLNHPNIARIYERAFASDFAYIAMEFCPHGDLSARLDKALPTETAVDYMRQIAKGLGTAHQQGIIHRDMKPGNILFREDESIAITDFGIAKTLGQESELTHVGSLVGTLLYISPEQIKGQEVNKYSDLYSLGVIFYKMLTGEYPFSGKSVEQLLNAHLTQSTPKLPGELSRYQPIVEGLLAKDPCDRFQNAEEFIVGLEWQ